jgi:hypothetical protein
VGQTASQNGKVLKIKNINKEVGIIQRSKKRSQA